MKVVRPYDPAWAGAFEREASALRRNLGETLVALHHIGSTAIPDMVAKPIIDILAEARSLDELVARTIAMERLGYEARGAYGIDGRRYFSKRASADGLGAHVHAYQSGSEHLERHLRFRDYLLIKPDVARDYTALKLSMSDADGVLPADYAARKAPFVERIERLALAHFAGRCEQ